MDNKYKDLFQPVKIGKVEIKNRIGMAAMGTNSDDERGIIKDNAVDYYAERAKGGAGLLISEAQLFVRFTDSIRHIQDGIGTEDQARQWGRAAEAAHKYGAKFCLQMMAGLGALSYPIPGLPVPAAACDMPNEIEPDIMCHGLTLDEVHLLVSEYGRVAKLAVDNGVDMIEINAHLGYLVDEFMTPLWNHRTDEYGGSFENRMRLPKEILESIRSNVGNDIPVIFKVSAYHDIEGGRTLEEGIEVCKYLESIGADALDIGVGNHFNEKHAVPYVFEENAYGMKAAAEIKKAVNIPVLNAGKYTPDLAEKAVRENGIDIVLFGRPMLADPDIANKIRNDEIDDIRPCMTCNDKCLGNIYLLIQKGIQEMITCAGNPRVGCEAAYPVRKTEHPKKVVVIGGGPAGMEAARVTAENGHNVTLYEKKDKLGGQLNWASHPRFKYRVGEFRDWQIRQLKKLGVRIELNKELKADSPELAEADKIFIALGSQPSIIPIKGYDLPNVVEVTYAHDHPECIKGNKIVVCGGGMSGCDAALDLAMDGKEVAIVEMASKLAQTETVIPNVLEMMREIEKYNITSYTDTKVQEFTENGIIAERNGEILSIPADTIIMSFGMKAEKKAAEDIQAKYPEAELLGDCMQGGGKIAGAVHSAFFAAQKVL